MARVFEVEEDGYLIEISSEQVAPREWRAEARARALDGRPEVRPLHTIAKHDTEEGAEGAVISMMRSRIRGNFVAD